jgi:hypothetical protein
MGKHAEKLWGLAAAVALMWTSAMVGCGGDEVNNPLPTPQSASVSGRLTSYGVVVPNVKVSIGADTTVTDQDGKYCLPAPPHQQVSVLVTFPPPLGTYHTAVCGAGGRVMTGDPGGCDHATTLDLTVVCTPI